VWKTTDWLPSWKKSATAKAFSPVGKAGKETGRAPTLFLLAYEDGNTSVTIRAAVREIVPTILLQVIVYAYFPNET
jgi:hypothetical protein